MKKQVLITGAAGFIGSNVARLFFNKGWNVVGIGNKKTNELNIYGITEWLSEIISLDTLKKNSIKPDVIIHCAGGSSVNFSIENPKLDFNLSVQSTSNILEYIREYSPTSKLVYLSSAAVYGEVADLPIHEETKANPVSPYGVHKYICESLCQLYSRQFSLSISIVRLFSIYGNGLKKQLLWDACEKYSNQQYDFFGTGDEVRDWLNVEDASNLIYIASQKANSDCPIVNGGTSIGISSKQILEYLGTHFKLEFKPHFTSTIKKGDPKSYIADITKAISWNWSPSINWRDGVENYINWYKQCQ